MKSIMKSDNQYLRSGRFITTLSTGCQVMLTPSDKVVGSTGVPLESYENSLIDDFVRDVFWLMFLSEPSLKKSSPVGREENRTILEWLMSDPTFVEKFTPLTNFKVSSAIAAGNLVEAILRIPQVGSAMSNAANAQDMSDRADALDEEADEVESGGDSADDSNDDSDENLNESQSPDEMRAEADELRQQASTLAASAKDELASALGESASTMLDYARASSIENASSDGNKIHALLETWGVDEGAGIMLSLEQINLILNSLEDDRIAKISTLLGRVYGMATRTLRGRHQTPIWYDEAGATKDVRAMSPQSLWGLSSGNPVRKDYVERWLKDGLDGIKKTSNAKQEGAFIFAIDESRSMDMGVPSGEGTRAEVSKAICLGIARAAKMNGQDFVGFGFGCEDEITDLVTPSSSMPEMLEFASHSFDGGTDFDLAIRTMIAAFENLEERDRQMTDFLVITDSECDISDDVAEQLDEIRNAYGAKLFALLIGNRKSRVTDLEKYADASTWFDGVDRVAEQISQFMWAE